MKRSLLNKITIGLLAGMLTLGLVGCGKTKTTENNEEKKTIVLAGSSGPYNELFADAVQPILEKDGYTIETVDFSDVAQSNVAITEGSIDFTVSQHTAYFENYNKERGTELTSIVHIPTVPAGIFSNKYTSIKDVKSGQIVAIPNDPSNAARAFRLLVKAGLIKVDEAANQATLTKNNITENPYNLDITEMNSSQIPRALDDVDFAVIPGSIVYISKLDYSKALLSEDVSKELELVVIVDKKNADSKWAKDIVAAYKSEEFKKYMDENNKDNYWFIPDELK